MVPLAAAHLMGRPPRGVPLVPMQVVAEAFVSYSKNAYLPGMGDGAWGLCGDDRGGGRRLCGAARLCGAEAA